MCKGHFEMNPKSVQVHSAYGAPKRSAKSLGAFELSSVAVEHQQGG